MTTPHPQPAMPYPNLTPDRQGRLSSQQLAYKALYWEFDAAMLRRQNAAKPNPTNFNDPAQAAKIRRDILNLHPEHKSTLDRVDALLTGGTDTPHKVERGDHPTEGFIGSEMSGSAPEEVYFSCAMDGCNFTVNHYGQSGTVGLAISNHRILVMCPLKLSASFTPYSLSWDDVKAARLDPRDGSKAALTVTSRNKKGQETIYILEGPNKEIADANEAINTWLNTVEEEQEKLARRSSSPSVTNHLLTRLGKFFNK